MKITIISIFAILVLFIADKLSASTIPQISGGGYLHSLALRSDGTIWAWGNNFYGQLGNGLSVNSTSPLLVSGLSNVSRISGGYIHSVTLVSDGTVWTWGNNRYGQLGDGSTIEERLTPVQVMNIGNIINVATKGWHNLALNTEGRVFSWGNNSNGQLGDGTRSEINVPVNVEGLEDIIDIGSGGSTALL